MCSLYITVAATVCPRYINPFPGFVHIYSTFLLPSSLHLPILSQGKTDEMATAPTHGATWLLHEDTDT